MTNVLRFKDITIDRSIRSVRKGGQPVDLTGLSFDLLWQLAAHAPEPLSIERLAETVWQKTFVSDQTVAQRVAMVRQALGDDASDPRFIRTVRGKGYAFIASHEEEEDGEKPQEPLSPGSKTKVRAVALIVVGAGLAISVAIAAWSFLRPPPVLLDPQNGALRLDNPDRPLDTLGFATVEGRSVMIAGLTDWSLVKSHPEVLGIMCSLRRDRSAFDSAIDPELIEYLTDPAKESDCDGIEASPPSIEANNDE